MHSNRFFLVVSIVVSVIVFTLLLQNVSVSELVMVFRELSLLGLVSFVILSLTGSLLRSWRYQMLLSASGHSVRNFPLFLITLVRNLFADLLPARTGTLVYVYLVRSRLAIPYVSGVSSFGLAFLFDLISMPPLIFLLLFADLGLVSKPILLAFAVVLLLVLLFVLLRLGAILAWVGRLFSSVASVQSFVSKLSVELEKCNNPKTLLGLFALSLGVRICKYGSLIIFLYALLLPLGYSPNELSIAKAFVGILTSEVSASLPFSGIAGFGLYEGTWAVVFRLLGLPSSIADVSAISHHLFTQAYGYGLGIAAFLALLFVRPRPMRREPSFAARLCLAATLIFVGFALAVHAERQEAPITTVQQATNFGRLSASGLPEGMALVFDSNRGGTFGIFKVAPGSTKIKVLFDSSTHHEMYPSIAPDATNVVFARSRSTKRLEPGEIWQIPLGSQEATEDSAKKVLENGTFPTFVNGGQDILFERRRKKAMAYNFVSGKTRELFPGKNRDWKNYQVVKPRLSEDGRYLTFTSDKPRPWHVWLIDLQAQSESLITKGCESSFVPGSKSILFIKQQGAHGGSAVMRYDMESGKIETVLDPHTDIGHEYFPNSYQSGNLIAYSAAPNDQHSHLSAEYSLFVSMNGVISRLTSDSFTNRWPQLVSVAK